MDILLYWWLGIILLLLILPFCSYFWGRMFGKGFTKSFHDHLNKLKTDNKNEQKETK
jgi:TM2 domain-containing membrane protein YozV